MDLLGDLPSELFSPAKMVYLGFILLAFYELLEVDLCVFLLVSIVFLLIEVIHNDLLRIILNGWGENNKFMNIKKTLEVDEFKKWLE